MAGQCRCGQVEIEVSAQPLITGACHCTGCQKMTGSAFSLTTSIPAESFASATRGYETVPAFEAYEGLMAEFAASRAQSRGRLSKARAETPRADEITEVVVRFALSFLMIPGPQSRTPRQLRAFLRRRLLPAVGLADS